MAHDTGGESFIATDKKGLEKSMHSILDHLEKTRFESQASTMEDLFPFLLVPGVVLIALEALVRLVARAEVPVRFGLRLHVPPVILVAARALRGRCWASRRARPGSRSRGRARACASASRSSWPQLETFDATTRRAVKGVLLVLAMLLAFVALARPQFGSGTRLIPATNLDVVIVLDYSKSMYARDIAPSRIARAKAEVARLIHDLPARASAPSRSPASR